ncbi:MAG: T9SS type A sorting domain-containing protein [candidate division Zixibacteria bacterium]|nr:T9SS type A sorting domain-containing protein [candidate division Zixibacteria bacterium]
MKVISIAVCVVLLTASAEGTSLPLQEGDLPIITHGGDNPLTTLYEWDGRGDALVFPMDFEGNYSVEGIFEVMGVPNDADIVHAFYVLTIWEEAQFNVWATFEGMNLPQIQPISVDQDPYLFFSLYRWDVTPYLIGNGDYSFSGWGIGIIYMAALVVIYEDPSLPPVRVIMNGGAESLQYSTSATTFENFAGGEGIMKIVLQGGDFHSENDESIVFNGEMLAGPDSIYRSNLGHSRDYFEFDVSNFQEIDTLEFTTGGDWIGINLALLIGGRCMGIQAEPDTYPIEVPPGGSFGFTGYLTNPDDEPLNADVWGGIIYLGNYYPLWNYPDLYFDPYETLSAHLIQSVPNYAPDGIYIYMTYTGEYPASCDSSSFEFMVTGNSESSPGADSWEVEGDWDVDYETGQANLVSQSPMAESKMTVAYPNPFNATTTITYQLPEAGDVKLDIYNIMGQKVANLVNDHNEAGQHNVVWDGSNYPSGVYFYVLDTGEQKITRKMVMLK